MEEIKQPQESQPATPAVSGVVRKFSAAKIKTFWPYILGACLVVILGVGAGWLISGRGKAGSETAVPGAKSGVKEAGLADEKTFTDSAEGVLEEGGINGEGTYHLTRPGGEDQTVYLTSTVVDLKAFVGKKVQIWGQTLSARKAGWLMDVGKIKVVE